MAAIHLANAVGGNVFLGFISAVAFATILAVVAGLTLFWASGPRPDTGFRVSRLEPTARSGPGSPPGRGSLPTALQNHPAQ